MSADGAVYLYEIAKQHVERSGFGAEAQWQATRDVRTLTESDLLRESAWVILCSGFREIVVRRCFPFLSLCFFDWGSSALICENAEICRNTALSCFRNNRKIEAILGVASHIYSIGFPTYKQAILNEPVVALQSLPFIGRVTAYHLAKNLGVQVAKPDRHLTRLAAELGLGTAHELCSLISSATGDSVNVVDIVLWRYMAIHGAVRS